MLSEFDLVTISQSNYRSDLSYLFCQVQLENKPGPSSCTSEVAHCSNTSLTCLKVSLSKYASSTLRYVHSSKSERVLNKTTYPFCK